MENIAALDVLLAKLQSDKRFMQLSNHQLHKTTIVTKLAAIELLLARLEADYAAMTYRRNKLVADCIAKAQNELQAAYENLFQDKLDRTSQLMSAAWLHTDFGRQLVDAEAIEHHLGESDYLELSEAVISWEQRVERMFTMLEQEVLKVRAHAKERSQGD